MPFCLALASASQVGGSSTALALYSPLLFAVKKVQKNSLLEFTRCFIYSQKGTRTLHCSCSTVVLHLKEHINLLHDSTFCLFHFFKYMSELYGWSWSRSRLCFPFSRLRPKGRLRLHKTGCEISIYSFASLACCIAVLIHIFLCMLCKIYTYVHMQLLLVCAFSGT